MRKIIAMLLTVAMTLSSFGFATISYAAEDVTGPQIDLRSLTMDTHTISDPYQSPTVKVKATDESEIVSVSLAYRVDEKGIGSASADLEYNESTGYFEGTVQYGDIDWSIDGGAPIAYYGEYKLWLISASDAYGNHTYIYDFPEQNGNFTVVGGNPEDKTAPVIDYSRIKVDKIVKKGNTAVMTIPITDDAKVYPGWVLYRNQNNDVISAYMVEKSRGIYQAILQFEGEGVYHLDSISAADENNNHVCIRNIENYMYSYDPYDDAQLESLGSLNIQYGQYVQSELTASIKSMELSSGIINRNAKGTLTVTFNASSPLKNVEAYYQFTRGTTQGMYGMNVTKIDDYTFQYDLPSRYYGPWSFAHVYMTDIHGNHLTIYNPDVVDSSTGVAADLSDADYYVGIVDPDTGLGISDTEFDKTTELEVEEESLGNNLYEDMVSEDAIGVGMYDVDVTGKRDDKTMASFVAPEGFRDGDKVSIVHKRHDGTNETFDAEVKHGRITIETDEFSPFVIQVDKDHEHRYTAKKIITKATLTKSGSYLKKCYACDATKGEKLKLKAAKASLSKGSFTYTGKSISSKKLPKVVVKDGSGNVIPSKYYTVTKPKNVKKMKAIGRYPYKITFKKTCKEYTGSKTIYLQITPKKTAVTSLKAKTKAVTVTWNKGKKAQVTGYQVMAATNSKFTKNKKTVIVKGYSKESKKLTKMKAKTKYYVKVRTYKTVKGVKIYSDWSKAKTVRTK